MPNLLNRSCFQASALPVFDDRGVEVVVVVVRAAFRAFPGEGVVADPDGLPVQMADVYRGEPGQSSVLMEADVAPCKPSAEVVVTGHARAPLGRKVTSQTVFLRVGTWEKRLMVHGDRFWRPGVLGRVPSSPEPFEKMPLIWERAFGGGDPASGDMDRRNLIGVGYRGSPPADPSIETEVANIENPGELITGIGDCPPPAGWGPVPRNSQPRLGWAGSYGPQWLKERWPLPSLDFDPRHHQSASVDQWLPPLRGGEPVHLVGMTPDKPWSFFLPTLDVPIRWRTAMGESGAVPLNIDTLSLEPDDLRFTLIGRAVIEIPPNRPPVYEVMIGHATPGWWRARVAVKEFLAPPGKEGTPQGRRDYRP